MVVVAMVLVIVVVSVVVGGAWCGWVDRWWRWGWRWWWLAFLPLPTTTNPPQQPTTTQPPPTHPSPTTRTVHNHQPPNHHPQPPTSTHHTQHKQTTTRGQKRKMHTSDWQMYTIGKPGKVCTTDRPGDAHVQRPSRKMYTTGKPIMCIRCTAYRNMDTTRGHTAIYVRSVVKPQDRDD